MAETTLGGPWLNTCADDKKGPRVSFEPWLRALPEDKKDPRGFGIVFSASPNRGCAYVCKVESPSGIGEDETMRAIRDLYACMYV
jgi:hypothetical protein